MQIIFCICLDFCMQFAPMKIGGLSTTDDWFVPHFPTVQKAFMTFYVVLRSQRDLREPLRLGLVWV